MPSTNHHGPTPAPDPAVTEARAALHALIDCLPDHLPLFEALQVLQVRWLRKHMAARPRTPPSGP